MADSVTMPRLQIPVMAYGFLVCTARGIDLAGHGGGG